MTLIQISKLARTVKMKAVRWVLLSLPFCFTFHSSEYKCPPAECDSLSQKLERRNKCKKYSHTMECHTWWSKILNDISKCKIIRCHAENSSKLQNYFF